MKNKMFTSEQLLNTIITTGPFQGKVMRDLTPDQHRILADLHRREAQIHDAARRATMNLNDDDLWTVISFE